MYAEDYSLFQQIQLFSSAKEIASISGTGLFNTFWCDSQTKVFEVLAVPGYHYHYKEFAEYSGTDHSYIDVIGLSDEDSITKIQDLLNEKLVNSLTGKIDMSLVEQARSENRIHIFKNVFQDL